MCFVLLLYREIKTLHAPKESTPSISPICTPVKPSHGPLERRQPIGADAETLSNHGNHAEEMQTDHGCTAIMHNGDDSILSEGDINCDLPEGHTAVPQIQINEPAHDEADSDQKTEDDTSLYINR